MKRVKGVTVTPHYCPIQDKDNAWYKQFQVIVMGLDSIEARRWLNAMACSLVEFQENESGVRKPDLGCARHRRACSPVGPKPSLSPSPKQDGDPAGRRRHGGLLGPRARHLPVRERLLRVHA